MKGLFATYIIPTGISSCFARLAMFCNGKGTLTTIFKFLNLRISGFRILPNIARIAANFCNPITILGLLLTGKKGNNRNSNRDEYSFHNEVKRLIAIEAVSIYVCCIFAWDTFNGCDRFAMTAILKLLHFITRWSIVIPFVNNSPIIDSLIPAVLARFLFTCNNGEDNYGNGNGYSFHIHKILIMVGFYKSKAKQLITNC